MSNRMRPADLVTVGTLGIRIRKLRSVLTAVGIAIGITAIVAVLGVGASSRADLIAQLDALGTNLLRVSAGTSFFGEASTLPEEASAMIERIGPVQGASGVTGVQATVRRNELVSELETGGIAVYAADPDLLTTLQVEPAAGRGLTAGDSALTGVVLGARAAARLGIDSLDGTPTVLVAGRPFAVVGVLKPAPLVPQLDVAALIGYDIAEELFATSRSPSVVFLRTNPAQVEAVMGVLAATANPAAPNEVEVTRPSDALSAREAVDTTFTALLAALGAVALLVAGIGIANVMVISVLERRTEIGLRRALGATRPQVAVPFVMEALLIAACGGAIGVLLGALATAGYARSNGWVFDVPAQVAAGGVAAALVVGGLAGIVPAWRAARLDPAEALRPG